MGIDISNIQNYDNVGTRTTAKSKLICLRNNMLKTVDEKVLEDTVKNRFSELKRAWEEVQRYHDQYVIQLPHDEDKDEEQWINVD